MSPAFFQLQIELIRPNIKIQMKTSKKQVALTILCSIMFYGKPVDTQSNNVYEPDNYYSNLSDKSSLIEDIYNDKFSGLMSNITYIDKQLTQLLGSSEQSVYLIGPTGSGKSTLINYLLGVKLRLKIQYGGDNYLLTQENVNITDPKIGNSPKSCTVLPKIYKSQADNIVYVDTPGFSDTKGQMLQIINSYATIKLFQEGNSVKLVILISQEALKNNRGSQLYSIIGRIYSMFEKDIHSVRMATVLIITKVKMQPILFEPNQDIGCQEKHRMDARTEQIKEFISYLVEGNQQMNQLHRQYLREILKFDQITILPLAQLINNQTLEIIKNKINKIKPIILSQNAKNGGLGDDIKYFLSQFEEKINKKFSSHLQKSLKLLRTNFGDNNDTQTLQLLYSARIQADQIKDYMQKKYSIILQISIFYSTLFPENSDNSDRLLQIFQCYDFLQTLGFSDLGAAIKNRFITKMANSIQNIIIKIQGKIKVNWELTEKIRQQNEEKQKQDKQQRALEEKKQRDQEKKLIKQLAWQVEQLKNRGICQLI